MRKLSFNTKYRWYFSSFNCFPSSLAGSSPSQGSMPWSPPGAGGCGCPKAPAHWNLLVWGGSSSSALGWLTLLYISPAWQVPLSPYSPGSARGDESPSCHTLPVPWPCRPLTPEHGGCMGGLQAGSLLAQAWLRGADNSHTCWPELRMRSVGFEEELIRDYGFKPGYVYNQAY